MNATKRLLLGIGTATVATVIIAPVTVSFLVGCDNESLFPGDSLGVVTLDIDFGRTTADVQSMRLSPWRRPGSRRPRDVRLTGTDWTRFRPGANEIIISFADRSGRVLGRTGLQGRALSFADRPESPGSPGLAGGRRSPATDARRVSVRVPPGTAYMNVVRAEVMGPERARDRRGDFDHLRFAAGTFDSVAIGAKLLKVFGLPESPKGRAPVAPPHVVVAPFDDPDFGSFPDETDINYGVLAATAPDPPDGPVATVVKECEADECYKIVVTGDGYLADEMDAYEGRLNLFVERLLGMEPFVELQDRLEIHSVFVASNESGIDRCNADSPDTYYGVVGGCPDDSGPDTSPTYMCSDPTVIYETCDVAVPYEDVNFYLVIANCDQDGGSAHPNAYVAYVAAGNDEEEFVNVATHECAHVIADLGEEYTGCGEWDGWELYWNIHYIDPDEPIEPQMEVWWSELYMGGDWLEVVDDEFVNLHACFEGGPCDDEHNLNPDEFPDVGLYWGAQFIEDDWDDDLYEHCTMISQGWDSENNPMSRNFYRSMATCQMRALGSPFCAACSALIQERLMNPGWFF